MESKILYEFEYITRDGKEAYLALFNDSLKLHISPEVYVYDLEGRPVFIYYNNVLYERGLSNEFVAKKWTSFTPPKRYLARVKDIGLKKRVVEYAHMRIKEVLSLSPPSEFTPILRKILYMNFDRLDEEGRRFYQIYKPISILPPDQYLALVLQPVEGCPYNKCSFCTFYRDRKFRFKTIDEFRKHVKYVINFVGKGILMRRKIFLADANALVTPMNMLKKYISIIYEYIPNIYISGLYSFMDYFTVRKDLDDFKWLRGMGLKMVYIGLETGDESLLKILNKPGPPEKAVEAVNLLKRAGIDVGVIVLIGAGGKKYFDRHVDNTIKILNEMYLDDRDIIYFSKLKVSESSEYYKISSKYGLGYLSDDEMEDQIRRIKDGLRHSRKPIQAIYDIDEFIY